MACARTREAHPPHYCGAVLEMTAYRRLSEKTLLPTTLEQ